MSFSIKSRRELALMARSGSIVAEVLLLMRSMVAPGVSTAMLNDAAHELIASRGATPSFLGHDGYPASICTSINAEVVHGIPGRHNLKSGDIISIDVGVYLHGYHADAALTLGVGSISNDAQRLIDATEGSFFAGLGRAQPGCRIGDISNAIQEFAEANGYGLAEGLTGHGIGTEMHEGPSVPNTGRANSGMRLRPGMTIAIEPMLTAGRTALVVDDDGWTYRTADGLLSAHFEHTVAISQDGPILLTAAENIVIE